MSLEEFFYTHPVFRVDELAEWKVGRGSHSRRAIRALLQHHLKFGRLMRMRRGLYAVVPPNETAETFFVDPYLIAGKVTEDSMLAYHSALELFGVAHSSFEQFTYLSVQKTKPFEFQNRWFRPAVVPINLRAKNDILFEVEIINRQGIDLRVTSMSRTFVDVLDRVELSGGWEEVIRSISNIAVLNIDHVIEYCLKLDNAILSAKIGYFLEQRQGAFSPTEEQINKLLKKKPTSPQYLSKKHIDPCKLIKKWNLMMPINIIQKKWEEPQHDV